MSRIADRLETLRKTSSPIGFGIAGSNAGVRRMLLLVAVRRVPSKKTLLALRDSADSIVLVADGEAGRLPVAETVGVAGDMTVGVRLSKEAQLADVASGSGCDFVICDADGSAEVLALEDVGCFIEVSPGVESSTLRAIAALGVEGVLLSTGSLDVRALAAAIECRRVSSAIGRPILLWVEQPVSSDQVSILYRAGVGALLIDVSGGAQLLTSARAAVDGASFGLRQSLRDTSVSIGTHVANLGGSGLEEEEEGDEEDGDDDEE